MNVVRRGATLVVVHLSGLNCIRERKSLAIREPDRGFGTESANASTAGVGQPAKCLPVEEISWSPRQSIFNTGWRRRDEHMQQFHVRPGCVKLGGVGWVEQHAGAFFRLVSLVFVSDGT